MKEELMRRTYLLKILVAILLVVGLLAPSTAIASSSTTVNLWIGNVSMSVSGVKQQIDAQGTKPVIVAGRTLVPIRAVIEAFGGSVDWSPITRNASQNELIVTLGKNSLDLWIGKSQASLNGTALGIDANPAVVPVITNGRTMLPLRFVAESLGINVQYDATSKMITLTYPPVVTPPAPFTLTVTSPNGGEVWTAGTTHTITWAVSGDMSAVNQLYLAYSTDSNPKPTIKPLGVDPMVLSTVRSSSWTVPNEPSPTCRVYVAALDSTNNILSGSGTIGMSGLFTITSPVVTPPVVTPPLPSSTITSADDLVQFLTTNFSVCNTSLGPTKFTFQIIENTTTLEPYDYWILEGYDTTFFFNLQYSNTITTEMNHVVCGELKQFQEELARAAIAVMPGKKLWGCYYSSYYTYPTLKLDLVASYYYSWVNYSPTGALTNYDDAKITGFSWWPLLDGKLER